MSDEENEYEEIEEEEEDEDEEDEEEEEEEPIDKYCIEDDEYEENIEVEKILTQPNVIIQSHPQEHIVNYEEVLALCTIQRDSTNNIVDPLHTSIPLLTKYEYTRILGVRATQIEQGAPLFIETDSIDSYWIAKEELHEKKLPFIIQRPIPNGIIEYWKLSDLEILF